MGVDRGLLRRRTGKMYKEGKAGRKGLNEYREKEGGWDRLGNNKQEKMIYNDRQKNKSKERERMGDKEKKILSAKL